MQEDLSQYKGAIDYRLYHLYFDQLGKMRRMDNFNQNHRAFFEKFDSRENLMVAQLLIYSKRFIFNAKMIFFSQSKIFCWIPTTLTDSDVFDGQAKIPFGNSCILLQHDQVPIKHSMMLDMLTSFQVMFHFAPQPPPMNTLIHFPLRCPPPNSKIQVI